MLCRERERDFYLSCFHGIMRDFDMIDFPTGILEPFKVRLCCVCDFARYGDVECIADPEITVDVVLVYIFNECSPCRLFVFENLNKQTILVST